MYFIHVPKSGGTFLCEEYCRKQNLFTIHHGEHPSCLSKEFIGKYCKYYWDTYLMESQLFNEADIKFTIIRNPFDMLKSYFISRWGDYDTGIKNKLPKKTFKELVMLFCSDNEWHIPLFQKFLYHQLFDDDGNCQCDYAIIYNNLEEGFDQLMKNHNVGYIKSRVTHNISKSENYKTYYDDEMIAAINKKCKLELDMFHFEFSGYKGNEYLLHIKDLKINWNSLIKMKTVCMMHLCCYPENKDSNHGQIRIQQYVDGLQKFFEYNDILKTHSIDVVLVDNSISGSFPPEILNVLPPNTKTITFKNNEYGKINKGSGLIEKWSHCRELIKEYDWLIHFEPRQLLLDFSFVETFLKNPRNLFTWGGIVGEKNDTHLYTGLFTIKSNTLLRYIDTIYLPQFTESIEYSLFRFLEHNYTIVEKANLMWHDISADMLI